eukprot:g3810.t1
MYQPSPLCRPYPTNLSQFAGIQNLSSNSSSFIEISFLLPNTSDAFVRPPIETSKTGEDVNIGDPFQFCHGGLYLRGAPRRGIRLKQSLNVKEGPIAVDLALDDLGGAPVFVYASTNKSAFYSGAFNGDQANFLWRTNDKAGGNVAKLREGKLYFGISAHGGIMGGRHASKRSLPDSDVDRSIAESSGYQTLAKICGTFDDRVTYSNSTKFSRNATLLISQKQAALILRGCSEDGSHHKVIAFQDELELSTPLFQDEVFLYLSYFPPYRGASILRHLNVREVNSNELDILSNAEATSVDERTGVHFFNSFYKIAGARNLSDFFQVAGGMLIRQQRSGTSLQELRKREANGESVNPNVYNSYFSPYSWEHRFDDVSFKAGVRCVDDLDSLTCEYVPINDVDFLDNAIVDNPVIVFPPYHDSDEFVPTLIHSNREMLQPEKTTPGELERRYDEGGFPLYISPALRTYTHTERMAIMQPYFEAWIDGGTRRITIDYLSEAKHEHTGASIRLVFEADMVGYSHVSVFVNLARLGATPIMEILFVLLLIILSLTCTCFCHCRFMYVFGFRSWMFNFWNVLDTLFVAIIFRFCSMAFDYIFTVFFSLQLCARHGLNIGDGSTCSASLIRTFMGRLLFEFRYLGIASLLNYLRLFKYLQYIPIFGMPFRAVNIVKHKLIALTVLTLAGVFIFSLSAQIMFGSMVEVMATSIRFIKLTLIIILLAMFISIITDGYTETIEIDAKSLDDQKQKLKGVVHKINQIVPTSKLMRQNSIGTLYKKKKPDAQQEDAEQNVQNRQEDTST